MRRMKRFMAFALSAAMMLTTVNMPEVTAWAQDTGKVTYYSTWSAAKNTVVIANPAIQPHGTGYIEL